VKEADSVRRSIGVALQDAAIDPLMTGRELIKLQSILHGIPRSEGLRRGAELLEKVGLSAAADRRVGTYSGGMRRRLDLALALIHEPIVLFLDEPTTGLDPSSRMTIWDELRMLNTEFGTTVFLTTQYMEEADRLADRISIIDNGVIVADGTPTELKSRVGDPTLSISLRRRDEKIDAERVLLAFGEPTGAAGESVSIRLPGGAAKVPAAVRALDEANIEFESLELHMPTLDDVFLVATGRRLEGAAEAKTEEVTG
jgi:ABC-2 type transport system ATP-binding protein